MVRLLNPAGDFICSITPADVMQHYATGAYQVGGSRTRVKYLKQTGPAPRKVKAYHWEQCWRTAGAGVVQPTPEWMRSVGYDVFGIGFTRYNAAASPLD